MEIVDGVIPSDEQLRELYDSVGWSVYTNDVAKLRLALAGSSDVVTAWDDDVLIGLARSVTDGQTVLLVQDVLVHPDRQRGGVGRVLIERLLAPYSHVRQKMLLTDDEGRQAAFYRSLGFEHTAQWGDGSLRSFVRFD